MSDTSIVDAGFRYYSNENYAYKYDINNTEDWSWTGVGLELDWSWTGVELSVESQTPAKLPHSIQYHVIQKIKDNYDVVFDDDGSGEVADIVAIKNNNDQEIIIDLFHCKYCQNKNGVATPGARVDDVYQVAGQAIKSIKWFADKEKLIRGLQERERTRQGQGKRRELIKVSMTI